MHKAFKRSLSRGLSRDLEGKTPKQKQQTTSSCTTPSEIAARGVHTFKGGHQCFEYDSPHPSKSPLPPSPDKTFAGKPQPKSQPLPYSWQWWRSLLQSEFLSTAEEHTIMTLIRGSHKTSMKRFLSGTCMPADEASVFLFIISS